ncbi:MAG TPA: PIN domain-containing protein [Candidatus Acidoferrales bacterium]|jgi:predicted nucleic acid-binding protein|nr:PIN domain-containing protein [Candidatus Acidoferrales bacterium]
MESALLGLVLDSSVLIAAERRKLTASQAIESVLKAAGEIPIVLCALSVAEIGHGIYRAITPEIRARRRAFLDELKSTVPVYPVTAATAEIVARIGGEQAAKGLSLPLGDLIIGACALELGYAVGTGNVRGFIRIPGLTLVRL